MDRNQNEATFARKKSLIEVEHVKAHRNKKERQHTSLFDNFVTEGNEKADEVAKEGAVIYEGFVAEARAATVEQERERRDVYVALRYVASFH